MSNIRDIIREKRIYCDGGMGSLLQARGLKPGEPPEMWNIERPSAIVDIHRQYLLSGANIITTNTFGVNSQKYADYSDLIRAAIKCAKEATHGFEDAYIAYDIGPLGRFLEPWGDLPFERAVEIFKDGIKVAKDEVDLIIIETMTDAYETKAAVMAAREVSDLPIFVTNAYDEGGKMLTGATPEAMVAMLEGLGVDAIGLNCSFGPDKMLPLVRKFYECSSLPIIANPNAGLPDMRDGKAFYSLDADSFAACAYELAENGVSILGGCCGTTPEYISALVKKTAALPPPKVADKKISLVSSYTHALSVGDETLIVGERINPTGKPKLRRALVDGDGNYVLKLALEQADRGAHILDVNVGVPGIDEASAMKNAVMSIQAVCDLPLMLDSSNPCALEEAMRVYIGKPIINSVNGEESAMEAIFPLVKKYGGMVVALTMDEKGIPHSADGRVEIAERIARKASEYGIKKTELIFDALAMTVATNPENARITAQAQAELSKRGYRTCLGVSNVSFGMPNRDRINASFFKELLLNKLSCAIINPSSTAMMDAYISYGELIKGNITTERFLEAVDYSSQLSVPVQNSEMTLKEAIFKGITDIAVIKVTQELEERDPLDIINNDIIPALEKVGEGFENQTVYLPQLLKSAEASGAAFSSIRERVPKAEANGNSVIIATVKGDVHDIGKNIVKLLLESYGFTVYDLGKNVPAEDVLAAVKDHSCKLVVLSALMTTTLPAMEKTVELLHTYDASIKCMVGGAVLTKDYADSIGADAYGKDAMSVVRYAQNFYSVTK